MNNTYDKTLIYEQKLLHYYQDHPQEIDNLKENVFASDIGYGYFETLKTLKELDKPFTRDNIVEFSVIDTILPSTVDKITESDYKDYDVNTLIQNINIVSTTDLVKQSLDNPSIQSLMDIKSTIDKLVEHYKNPNEEDTFKSNINKYVDVLEDRQKQGVNSTGCPTLDKLVKNMVAGFTCVVGYSGSTKSTFIHHIARQRLFKRLPTILVNTELAQESLMDALVSPLAKIEYSQLRCSTSMIDIEKIKALGDRYENSNFSIYPKYNASLAELELYCKEKRTQWNIPNDKPMMVLIDLLSMLKDFSTGSSRATKADTIEESVFKLNEIALNNNLQIMGTVQLKRAPNGVVIENEEDLEKLVPTLEGIKSSGAWEERARLVLAVHNPVHLVSKEQSDPVYADIVRAENEIQIRVLKDTYNGMTGAYGVYGFDNKYKCYVNIEKDIRGVAMNGTVYSKPVKKDNNSYEDEDYENNIDISDIENMLDGIDD